MTLKLTGQIAFSIAVLYAMTLPFIETKNNKKPSEKTVENPVVEHVKAIPAPEPKVKPVQQVIVNEHLPEFGKIRDVKAKKKAFFSYLKPFVEQINQQILQQREFVRGLHTFPSDDLQQQEFNRLVKKYRIKEQADFAKTKQALLNRLDVIPVPLVLMQAANESAWGTSRFALAANNLFGQWCFKVGCGVIPEGRPAGKTYEVRKFNHPADSIRSYFHNLNTGHAYQELRDIREVLRLTGQNIDASVLAQGLTAYSTRRQEYVTEIQNMIRINTKYI